MFSFGDIMMVGDNMGYEKLTFTVIEQHGKIEVRQYDAYLIMKVNKPSNQGFSTLFNYISGGNTRHQKISMTVPVITDVSNKNYIAFTMPKTLRSDYPAPTDPNIQIIEMPAKTYLATTFKGNQRRYKKALDALLAYAKSHHITLLDDPIMLRYQPPFLPWFLKKSDIIVEIN